MDLYDYIIIGGGTAGLTVASRLSEDAAIRVLVVEAGCDHVDDPLVTTPGLVTALIGNGTYDWKFTSVPQVGLDNRCAEMARGKGLGGSSAINFMTTIFPTRASIDQWRDLGNEGWSYNDVAPYFRKFARRHEPTDKVKKVTRMSGLDTYLHGDGPIQMSYGEAVGPVNTAWADAHAALGIKPNGNDPWGGDAVGTFFSTSCVDPETKTRSYAATGYYGEQIRARSNLTVLCETLVTKIHLKPQDSEVVATGVQLKMVDGSMKNIRTNREMILAAGAIQSPQILEVSGIGSRELLERHNIPVIIDNPGVGENLQDHPQACMSYELRDNAPSIDAFRDSKLAAQAMEQYQATKGGPLASISHSVSYLPVLDSAGIMSLDERKALLHKCIGETQNVQQNSLKKMLSQPDEPAMSLMWFPCQTNIEDVAPNDFGNHFAPHKPENYGTLLHALGHPLSRGSCHTQSPSVEDVPVIDLGYFTHPLDVELTARSIMFGEKLLSTEPLASAAIKPNGARLPAEKADTLEEAIQAVRARSLSNMHPCGTCSMMPRAEGGVVNSRLLVYGTRNLRVVDASIFPLIPLGNIMPTVYAVAERAADFIKADA
ncbi:hypothetical protein NW762_013765 [Fusarium torreyae]|uniref:Glucose-methanol-choline oxidoreductase N-terminal domain-containing protein n=1 Tax=Fusarium torreyae TaxID=1237075 RepID=A0A9W8RMT4_9HYPO|nr:hypothetical protein NW762_013765 [Fusarium torreyae]